MSLIHEALQKARREAAEQADASRADGTPDGLLGGPGSGAPESSAPRRRGSAAPIVVAVMIALVAGLIWWSSVDRRAPVESLTPAAAPEPETVEASVVEPEPTPVPVPPPAPMPVKTTPSVETPSAETPSVETPSPEPTAASEPGPELRPQPEEPAKAEPVDDEIAPAEEIDDDPDAPDLPKLIEPPEVVGKVAEDVYVLEAKLDGVTLVLDFIVWSPPSPFAQVNGKQVEVGQSVDGFVVASVEKDRVILQGASRRVVLRVR